MKNVVCVYVKDNLILGTEDYREDFHLYVYMVEH